MQTIAEIIEIARTKANWEIEKYNSPNPTHFQIANTKGQDLAQALKADKDVVALGTIFMDFKIGEAISANRLKDHIQMSHTAAWEFLYKAEVPEATIQAVLNCIDAHHKTVPWTSLEAEVCANADCYRFLSFEGITSFIVQLASRDMTVDAIRQYALTKVEEKWGIVSLPIVKAELEPNYQILKQFLS